MTTYNITVYDDFFMQSFPGNFHAENIYDAIKDCKDFYAMELDTYIDEIVITEIKFNNENEYVFRFVDNALIGGECNGNDIEEYNYEENGEVKKLPADICSIIDELNEYSLTKY